jgi:hypothetical protein
VSSGKVIDDSKAQSFETSALTYQSTKLTSQHDSQAYRCENLVSYNNSIQWGRHLFHEAVCRIFELSSVIRVFAKPLEEISCKHQPPSLTPRPTGWFNESSKIKNQGSVGSHGILIALRNKQPLPGTHNCRHFPRSCENVPKSSKGKYCHKRGIIILFRDGVDRSPYIRHSLTDSMWSRFRPLNGLDCRAPRRNGIRSQIWRRGQPLHWRQDGAWHHHLLQYFFQSGQVRHISRDDNPGYVRLACRYKQMLCYVIFLCLFYVTLWCIIYRRMFLQF